MLESDYIDGTVCGTASGTKNGESFLRVQSGTPQVLKGTRPLPLGLPKHFLVYPTRTAVQTRTEQVSQLRFSYRSQFLPRDSPNVMGERKGIGKGKEVDGDRDDGGVEYKKEGRM